MTQGKNIVIKWQWLLFFTSFTLFFTAFFLTSNPNNKGYLKSDRLRIQNNLQKEISALQGVLNQFSKAPKSTKNQEYFLHYFKDGALEYWNNNKFPINKENHHHHIKTGVNQLPNGWYYTLKLKNRNVVYYASFLIKTQYQFENEYLINAFNPNIYEGIANISLNKSKGQKVFDVKGKYLFSIQESQLLTTVHSRAPQIFILIVLAFLCCSYGLYLLLSLSNKRIVIGITSLLIVRVLFIYFPFPSAWLELDFNAATLFAWNALFPNLLAVFLNGITVMFLLFFLLKLRTKNNTFQIYRVVLLFLVLFSFWCFHCVLLEVLVSNSTLPLTLTDPFLLNTYSYAVLLLFAALNYTFYRCFLQLLKRPNPKYFYISLLVFWVIASFSLLLFYPISPIILLFPTLLIVFETMGKTKENRHQNALFLLLILAFFSFVFVFINSESNSKKELEKKEVYSNQLTIDRDYELELDYSSQSSKIKVDTFLTSLFSKIKPDPIVSGLNGYLENKYLKGIWDGYDINVIIKPLSGNIISNNELNEKELEDLIYKKSERSEIDSSVFFIRDGFLGISYIIVNEMYINNQYVGNLYFTLKSKKIPKEIGFPRLLLSNEAKVFTAIEQYATAKYINNVLIKQSGPYNFPTHLNKLTNSKTLDCVQINKNGYTHFIRNIRKGSAVVLSNKTKTNYDLLTSFSYVFCFWGGLLLLSQIVLIFSRKERLEWSLAFKIQVASVALVALSLLFFGVISVLFVSRQYNAFTDRTIIEKAHAMEGELASKTKSLKDFSSAENILFLESLSLKLSKMFETDINIYDSKGFLLASSKPKLFSLGLLSKQINSMALLKIRTGNESLFSQKETIGTLSFNSTYLPLRNGRGDLFGYLNIQHFNKQRELEMQIQQFIVAIMNVFLLLLCVAIIISLLISNRLVQPLKQLQLKVKQIQFSNRNQHIQYSNQDEIGEIVSAYNGKLDELELAIKQLKANERESAWRDVAKQVAHEIKNPLTPIKLSVQHLLRLYDPSNPASQEKLQTVVQSIIEQIDALTKITNDFSNFAQVPHPVKQNVDIISLTQSCVSVLELTEKIDFIISTELKTYVVLIDKEQWIQVMNNLLKNAIQACGGIENAKITIQIKAHKQGFIIEISDTGCGMDADKLSKVFTPYFTTKSSGSGIGLSIVKQIVENHGGQITCDSKEGQGSTFAVMVP